MYVTSFGGTPYERMSCMSCEAMTHRRALAAALTRFVMNRTSVVAPASRAYGGFHGIIMVRSGRAREDSMYDETDESKM